MQSKSKTVVIRNPHIKRIKKIFGKGVVYIILATGAALYLFPFIWMLSTSLKTPPEVMMNPPIWIPAVPQWQNFVDALTHFPFLLYLGNTVFLVVINVIGVLFSSSIAAYSFARLRWPGRDYMFYVLLATMMLPGAVTMIPQFILFNNFGWHGTYLPLTVPAFMGGAFNIFLLRQFFRTIPMELSEAAKIDGCPEFFIFLKVIMPLTKPALAAIGIFTFMGTWNDFLGPLLYVSDPNRFTLTFGLRTFQMQYDQQWHLLMAASIVVALPTLVAFFAGQKYFIEGITITGIKG